MGRGETTDGRKVEKKIVTSSSERTDHIERDVHTLPKRKKNLKKVNWGRRRRRWGDRFRGSKGTLGHHLYPNILSRSSETAWPYLKRGDAQRRKEPGGEGD